MARIVSSGLCKSFAGTEVVKEFDLEIADHEFIVFLGPSGCGKSTILRMIAGLETISAGTLSIDGKLVNDLSPRQRNVAMVFQNYALYPHLTVFDNIAFGLRRMQVARPEISRRVAEVVGILGLEAYLDRKPAQLSGGQQQRVAIARAVVKTPGVFLFDEPLSNLDATLRNHMRIEIARLHKRLRTTSIYVTHDQMEAMTLADRIVLLKGGRIEQVGSPAALYHAPCSLFAGAFIGTPAMNLITGIVSEADGQWLIRAGAFAIAIDRAHCALGAGMAVVLGIRPADLVQAISADAPNLLNGTVELVEFIGNDALLYIDRPGETDTDRPITALVPAQGCPPVGASVGFTVRPERVHVFDAQSGLSCARAAA